MTIPESCLGCAACCAGGQGYWIEVTPTDAGRLSQAEHDIERAAMRTAIKNGTCRCIALTGDIGTTASCSIYPRRPGICRTVERGGDFCLSALDWHIVGRGIKFKP